MDPDTIARWAKAFRSDGVAGVVPVKTGPKGPSKLTDGVAAEVRARRDAGESLRTIATAVGISTGSVRRALQRGEDVAAVCGPDPVDHQGAGPEPVKQEGPDMVTGEPGPVPETVPNTWESVVGVVPVLPAPVPRTAERVLARRGLLVEALPVFHPAGRVGLAGLFLALPGLEASGLLEAAHRVYQDRGLPGGFYGLDAMLVEGVVRCLAGEPRAEGATRVDPYALGRVLGLDRAPEVKTIRRRIGQLAGQGKAEQVLAAMARHHLTRHDDPAQTGLVVR